MTRTRKKKLVTETPVIIDTPTIVEVIETEPTIKAKSPMELWLELAPDVINDLTQQWYGETFVPQYHKWLREGYLLAKQ
jgi:hypothetical protein